MSDSVISVTGLAKRYYLSHEKRQDTLRDSLVQKFRRLTGRTGAEGDAEEFWALRDVSFDLEAGAGNGNILQVRHHAPRGAAAIHPIDVYKIRAQHPGFVASLEHTYPSCRPKSINCSAPPVTKRPYYR